MDIKEIDVRKSQEVEPFEIYYRFGERYIDVVQESANKRHIVIGIPSDEHNVPLTESEEGEPNISTWQNIFINKEDIPHLIKALEKFTEE